MPIHSPDTRLRKSSTNYSTRQDIIEKVASVISSMISPAPNFKRLGYPRAGGIDRLGIFLIELRPSAKSKTMIYWRVGQGFTGKHVITPSSQIIKRLNQYFPEHTPNGVIIAWGNDCYGLSKYNLLNTVFSEQEPTILGSMIHSELCSLDIPNHFFGGLSDISESIWNFADGDSYPVTLCF